MTEWHCVTGLTKTYMSAWNCVTFKFTNKKTTFCNIYYVFSSFHELMQSCGVRRPSVHPSVNILRKSLLLPDKWLNRDQICQSWSPDGPASRMCSKSRSRSKVTWYGHFCDVTKILSSRGQMAGSPPNLHMMVSRLVCAENCWTWTSRLTSNFTRYGHIRFHKNRFFSQANGCILTKLSLSLTPPTLCPFGFLLHSNPPNGCQFFCSMEAQKLINCTVFSFSRTFQVLENQGKKLQDFSRRENSGCKCSPFWCNIIKLETEPYIACQKYNSDGMIFQYSVCWSEVVSSW